MSEDTEWEIVEIVLVPLVACCETTDEPPNGGRFAGQLKEHGPFDKPHIPSR